ncbi:hypothetical protein IHE55_00800 [Streptomyces pactum]|uniref:Serine/threonine protein kinase n=1 Tax=Streptomyces pactum TaxID=68249 RepID=A0ABS0NE23_9ACTN|nr:hypothetical protein [Streptomyces pactum]MBH5333416.1 hypothetical protein [Streptomyces pactum]
MSYRAALVALFLAPGIWGAVTLGGSLSADSEVVCPGENVGADGEERPGPMRPGDTRCVVLDGSAAVATRDYDQQRRAQSLERRQDATDGALYLLYGAAGALVAWRATRPRDPMD